MRFTCLQENLSRGLALVGRAVATRTTLPITQNVLIETDQGRLKLSATNLELAVTTWVGGEVQEEGAVTIPARLLTDFINSLPAERVENGDDHQATGGPIQVRPLSGEHQRHGSGGVSANTHGGRGHDRPRGAARAADGHRPGGVCRRNGGGAAGAHRRQGRDLRAAVHTGRCRRIQASGVQGVAAGAGAGGRGGDRAGANARGDTASAGGSGRACGDGHYAFQEPVARPHQERRDSVAAGSGIVPQLLPADTAER